jgi:hypothetical protein
MSLVLFGDWQRQQPFMMGNPDTRERVKVGDSLSTATPNLG